MPEYELNFVTETAAGLCVDDGSDEDIWLPKSQVRYHFAEPGIVIVDIPEWLAVEKGLE